MNGEPAQSSGIDIPIPWSTKPLRVTGVWAIAVILYLAMGWYIKDRAEYLHDDILAQNLKMDELACNQNLAIFAFQYDRGKVMWDELPAPLYRCLAEFKRKQTIPMPVR